MILVPTLGGLSKDICKIARLYVLLCFGYWLAFDGVTRSNFLESPISCIERIWDSMVTAWWGGVSEDFDDSRCYTVRETDQKILFVAISGGMW